MSDNTPPKTAATPPQPQIRQRKARISLVWLVPIVAGLIGLSMALHDWMNLGPKITVSFETAEGLEANKTQVKYKNVVIGMVTAISLSEDRTHVLATIELNNSAGPFTRVDSQYWVVRPRIGAHGISGVDTLLSGAFINADAGNAEQTTHEFVGLETPPPVTFGEKGKRFILHTDDLGSLDIGSPIYYRRIQVGQVVGYNLSDDGKGVDVQIFINAPNDKYITTDTRFWNASGVDVTVGTAGLKIDTQSLASIVSGGIAFREPNWSPDAKPAAENAEFRIFDDQATALAPPDGDPLYIRMRFKQSLRGLAVGAPVDFLGVNIGKVLSVDLDYDGDTRTFPGVVGALIYPKRLGAAEEKLRDLAGNGDPDEQSARILGSFIGNGLRAQVRTGNLLTGQLYIAMEFDPKAPKVTFNPRARPLEIPTVPGSFDKLQEQLQAFVDKLGRVPIDELAANLNGSLSELQKTLKTVNGSVLPHVRGTLQQAEKTLASANDSLAEDSPGRQQLGQMLEEVQRAARSMRVLTDFLSRQPESLIRGRSGDAAPASYKSSSRTKTLEPQQ
ncbi:MlaD family protein [Pseudomonas sp. DTU_2021_1001937_2_SI_NGA_ILE_001]|uniref:PqiB family protein n=1 Tax=Pseudomonas sp. DTU_2021_1001937_2_SI_NGA_ILE_001 TaxID=3077589 RepID=UPI0028FC25FE|nr:MlaD family protein [Pseudomonas sp. DTU_2021_1001937_2_SI_NGA_ILE_001]WNW10517.1 MlaD family protein [Pseudomonas sp. DTU_2021_1001937_2_SI_NGA_ILE_001]